jgi:hypothetical protein
MLGQLVELHALAQDPEALFPRVGGHGHMGARREPPAPLSIAALDVSLGADMLGVLESWERWWREHARMAPWGEASAAYAARTRENGPRSHGTPGLDSTPTSRTLVGCVGFLRAQWPTFAAMVEPPPDEFAAEVRALHREAMTALSMSRFDLDPDPLAVEPPDYTIPCPHCAVPIGMRRAPHDDERPDTTHINCDRCGWHGTAPWLIRVSIAAGARPAMSLHQVREHYGVTERTVRRWVASGRLERRRGMYLPTDVVAVVSETRTV